MMTSELYETSVASILFELGWRQVQAWEGHFGQLWSCPANFGTIESQKVLEGFQVKQNSNFEAPEVENMTRRAGLPSKSNIGAVEICSENLSTFLINFGVRIWQCEKS